MASRRRTALLLTGVIALHALMVGAAAIWWVHRAAPAAPEATLEALGTYGVVPPFALTERSGRRTRSPRSSRSRNACGDVTS